MSRKSQPRGKEPMTRSGKDRLVTGTATRASDFVFDEKVAGVFDDMVSRSVPFYREVQHMVLELAREFRLPGSRVYDLGCSTGTTLLSLAASLDGIEAFVGYDNSQPMLDKAAAKLKALSVKQRVELRLADLMDPALAIKRASVVTMCWTLQFIRPMERLELLRRVCQGMLPGGAFIVIDKVLNDDPTTNNVFIKLYYDFKRRNGYSDEEIVRKREALENVLIPYRMDENLKMFRQAGFATAETFFRWYNFAGFVCLKA